MKNDDLLEFSESIDESYIEEVGRLRMSSEMGKCDENGADIISIRRKRRYGLSRAAVAVIAFASVLVLGGGAVWAMTASPLRDFFFKNSDKQYEEIYTNIGKKYEFKNIDLILEESIYDKAVGSGYTSISVWDKEGNPVVLQGNTEMFWGNFNETFEDAVMDLRGSAMSGYRIGEDVFYLLAVNADGYSGKYRGNTIFRHFRGRKNEERVLYKNEMEYIVLNEEQYSGLYNDLVALSENKESMVIYNNKLERNVPYYRFDTDQPDVIEVLDRYDPVKVQTIDVPAQEIMIDNLKITVGRTDMVLEYKEKECDLSSFALLREDGTRIDFKRKLVFPQWEASEYEKGYSTSGATEYDDGFIRFVYNLGFILGVDEKVTIEANGEIYE